MKDQQKTIILLQKTRKYEILNKMVMFFYFNFHKNTSGLLFYDEDFGGLRIKFDPIESEQ